MKQEDKELLLIDLCGRLPYGVMVGYSTKDNPNALDKIGRVIYVDIRFGMIQMQAESGISYGLPPSEFIKPYLRPLYSMTREERKELERLIDEKLNGNTEQEDDEWTPWVLHDTTGIRNSIGGEKFYFDEMSFIYDWLNSHHLDYRGLISKGLAIKVTQENNPYNKE